jgi:hypothetical protein
LFGYVLLFSFSYFIFILFSILCYFHFYMHEPLFLYTRAILWWCKNITFNIHEGFLTSLSSYLTFFPFNK